MIKTRSICLMVLVLLTATLQQVVNQANASDFISSADETRPIGRLSIGSQDRQQEVASDNSVALYKEPSSLVISILKNFFDDIDWDTIDKARVQIEKFIHKVDKMIGSVRSIFTKATADNSTPREGNSFAGRWWTGGAKSMNSGEGADSTSVKEMLERVACFVGYMRLMNLSNEALAELDAAKVVTNLFGSAKRTNSSGWNWFG